MGLATSDNTVEHKVTAGAAGGGVGGTLAAVAVWALGTYVYHGDVPAAVQAAVYALLPAVVAFASGWAVKHTPRQDDFLRLVALLADETTTATVAPAPGDAPAVDDTTPTAGGV